MRKRILIVIGTRPEAIKLTPIIEELRSHEKDFELSVCFSGQHNELLRKVASDLNLIPSKTFVLDAKNQSLAEVNSRIQLVVQNIIEEFKPDLVLVQGDTTTALATSMVAFYNKKPIAHIEAGLRTHNLLNPFPEELNRQLISKLASFHFAPTEKNKENLLRDGVRAENIFVTGNTVVDALKSLEKRFKEESKMLNEINQRVRQLVDFDFANKSFILVTLHRRESFGEVFQGICLALREIARKFPSLHFIYPVHLNPNVQIPVKSILSEISNFHLVSPLGYQEFVYLLQQCYFIITDSGGIQEEAPNFGKPLLLLRDTTERSEAIISGNSRLVGTNPEHIISEVSELILNKTLYVNMSKPQNPFGDGLAAKRIVEAIKKQL